MTNSQAIADRAQGKPWNLEFKDHKYAPGALQARVIFDDGSELSILTFKRPANEALSWNASGLYCGYKSYEVLSNRFPGCIKRGGWPKHRSNSRVKGWMTWKEVKRHLDYVLQNPII